MQDQIGIVGLYGMGGTGKTIILKQINNKFYEIVDKVDFVIWIVVSHDTTIHKVQRDIARKLGILEKEWDQKKENERAFDIRKILMKWKFVLLLDDIWEKVNLEATGVPYPSRENGCKVIFTTRSIEVCRLMGVDDPMELNVIEETIACGSKVEEKCEMLEIKIENKTWNKSLIKGICFSNLSSLTIQHCNGLKDLTWLLPASNLKRLEVRHLKEVESIISKDKVSKVLDEEETCISIIPFQRLEVLILDSLPVLKSIYWSSLPFPCLKKIDVFECDKLWKLPLDSKSVVNVEEFVIVYEDPEWADGNDWIEDVEWKDEATRLRFLPSLRTT